jgi:hypothetical protein
VQNECDNVLYDIPEQTAISPVFKNWVAEDWYPRSLEAGLKFVQAIDGQTTSDLIFELN